MGREEERGEMWGGPGGGEGISRCGEGGGQGTVRGDGESNGREKEGESG